MTEFERNSAFEYMDNYARRRNARFEYNNFVQAIKAKNNQAIETTKVYELLKLLLSSKNCVCFETLSEGKHLFRGRRMNIDDCLIFNKIQVDDDEFIHGFDALGYRSYISQGKNYTVFNCCESNISFVSSEIVYVGQQSYDFRKINSGKKLIRPTASKPNYEEIIRRIKNYIFNSTRHFDSIK